MKPAFELFVFDWDGTVMDTVGLIAQGICEAAEALGCARPSIEVARQSIGLSWSDIIARACPDCPPERFEEFNAAYRRWYLHREKAVPVVEGIGELIENMAKDGLRLAVATGKSRAGLERVFAQTGLGRWFEASITADESFSKPNPAMLYELRDVTGVPLKRMVMIGDSTHDLLMAQNAGCASVGVTTGGASREELLACSPVGVAGNTQELAAILGVTDYL